jgi:hypothetical protein
MKSLDQLHQQAMSRRRLRLEQPPAFSGHSLPGPLSRVLGTLAALFIPVGAQAATLGMVADGITRSVIVFDADTGAVHGSIGLPTDGIRVGDCAISFDQTRGYVTDAQHNIWVIDLTATPPSLASGPNPIAISSAGMDLALSPDGKYTARRSWTRSHSIAAPG